MGQVVLKGINKFYDSVHAVKDVNLQIRDKEFVVFVGPSGCGKTTTLRMIAGLEAISSGDISIDGNVVNDLAPMDRDIAMVFQNYALYPHMSVYDNMAFGLKMRKFDKAEIDKRVKEAADILGIGELLKRKPRQLSGGQRQRVALGRAIVRHPRVFLFDEPLSNLDAKLRVQMRVELKKLHLRLGTTAIYVTHDQVEAMTLGDRVVVMKDGVVQQVGEPLELYNQPGQQVRRRLHRLAGDELRHRDGDRGERLADRRERRPAHRGAGRDRAAPARPCRPRGHARHPAGGPARGERRRSRRPDASMPTIEVIEQLGSEILLDVRVGDGMHGGERRADRAGEGARQAAPRHAPVPAARLRREDRSGDLNACSAENSSSSLPPVRPGSSRRSEPATHSNWPASRSGWSFHFPPADRQTSWRGLSRRCSAMR